MPPRRTKKVVETSESSEAEAPIKGRQNDPPGDVDDVAPASPTRLKGKKRRAGAAVFADASSGNPDRSSDAAPSNSNSPRRPGPQQQKGPQRSVSSFVERDDRVEKKRRRQSARVSFVNHSSDVEGGEGEGQNGGRGEGNGGDASKGSTDRVGDVGEGLGSPATRRPRMSASRINAVAPAPAPVVSIDVMNSNFEEWMKMATDNKINATNSWNFALIDYFHDMSLLRNTDDNSINFQKASFTLDGCVKIWTSRVDSVGTETGKLLSNLAQDGGAAEGDEAQGEDVERDAEVGEGDDKGKKRKVHRTESTLAKSYAQLQVKKLELDFAVDPLFRKTRAEFDEGGATGLLMNHLGIDSNMRVVFDSGDSKVIDDEEEAEEDPHAVIDLGHIRGNFMTNEIFDTVDLRTIAQDFSDFRFSSDPNAVDLSFLDKIGSRNVGELNPSFDAGNEDSGGGFGADFSTGDLGDDGEAQDFFTGDNQVPANDFGMGGGGGMDSFDDDTGEGAGPPVIGGMERFDPRRPPNERDLVMAMNDEEEGEMLDYFDTNFMKNWAGPEHWKLRRSVRKVTDPAAESQPRARREKAAFTISFTDPIEASQTTKSLFVPATKASMLQLPSSTQPTAKPRGGRGRAKKGGKKLDDHLLPDDMHFTSQQLLRLFLKPKFTLKMRRHVRTGQESADGEVDEHFWAAAQANSNGNYDRTEDGGPIPFNTQFFHDDDDDDGPGLGFDDDMDADPNELIPSALDDEGTGDLLAATQETVKRVRLEFVNYARKAKRVDVRKLKENIWKGLNIITEPEASHEGDEEVVAAQLTDPSEPRKFESVIQGLRGSYTREKMDEISTSFCFICLLHLANERGLKIEVEGGDKTMPDNNEDLEDDGPKDKSVGDIWSLNVFRDPNATVAA
ncbi:condensin complex subunit 2/barren [Cantharellus anzutake]|uniref:condensin complex subunit 2/barren n=1 Tax=Cantharellus anzutake TaxID=1750568 RepID=UPI001905DFB4|nr:condensin complex subunit 2/barren [Cantharellus anzutake]KAF8329405.1 condensin complex subunit 2/barren [Cantharellus anzutake]